MRFAGTEGRDALLAAAALAAAVAAAVAATARAAGSSEESSILENRSNELAENLRRQLMRDNSDYSQEAKPTEIHRKADSELDKPRENITRNHYHVSKQVYRPSYKRHDDRKIKTGMEKNGNKNLKPESASEKDLLYYVDDEKLIGKEPKDRKYKTLKVRHQFRRSGQNRYIQEEADEGVAIVSLSKAPFPELHLPRSRRQYLHDHGEAATDDEEIPPPPVHNDKPVIADGVTHTEEADSISVAPEKEDFPLRPVDNSNAKTQNMTHAVAADGNAVTDEEDIPLPTVDNSKPEADDVTYTAGADGIDATAYKKEIPAPPVDNSNPEAADDVTHTAAADVNAATDEEETPLPPVDNSEPEANDDVTHGTAAAADGNGAQHAADDAEKTTQAIVASVQKDDEDSQLSLSF